MRELFKVAIPAELEDVHPFGDCVLVQRIDADERGETVSAAGVISPKIPRHKVQSLHTGVVLRVGLGDRLIVFRCRFCNNEQSINASHGRPWGGRDYSFVCSAPKMCAVCRVEEYAEDDMWEQVGEHRRSMGVKPGDTILYPRVPANDVRMAAFDQQSFNVGGGNYTFLHEEQHVWAILEEAA
jgi:co-chaperonin GroES (HSP10)